MPGRHNRNAHGGLLASTGKVKHFRVNPQRVRSVQQPSHEGRRPQHGKEGVARRLVASEAAKHDQPIGIIKLKAEAERYVKPLTEREIKRLEKLQREAETAIVY